MKHAARSLFDDDDAPSNRTSVTISGGAGRPLSKAQARFNALIEQIGKKRERLAAWDAVIPRYQRRRVDDLTPLVEEALDLQIEMVHCLDRAAAGKGLTIRIFLAGATRSPQLGAGRPGCRSGRGPNAKARSELDRTLAYPSWRDGFRDGLE